jgi:hypothetical protein
MKRRGANGCKVFHVTNVPKIRSLATPLVHIFTEKIVAVWG